MEIWGGIDEEMGCAVCGGVGEVRIRVEAYDENGKVVTVIGVSD